MNEKKMLQEQEEPKKHVNNNKYKTISFLLKPYEFVLESVESKPIQ